MKVFVALIDSHNMVHWFAWKQMKQNISKTVQWRDISKTFLC